MAEQLLLFPETPEERVNREIKAFKEHIDKVRKSQYAEISTLKKHCAELKHELETLKRAMCQSNSLEPDLLSL